MAVTYNAFFYDEMKDSSRSSAEAVVPRVMEMVSPRSVVDVGCAEGVWLSVFQKNGVEKVTGVDGSWVDMSRLRIEKESFIPKDLEHPLGLTLSADMVVCMEIAEHLESTRADSFIRDLVGIAPVILFSAAIPLQGGSHHVNEQWPDYWEAIFAKYGYVPVDCLRRTFWNDKRVSFFYAQNLFFYVKKSELHKYPKLRAEYDAGNNKALSFVHPYMYLYFGERWRMLVPFLGKIPPGVLHFAKRMISHFRDS